MLCEKMNNKDILKENTDAIVDAIQFFSNDNKEKREEWVVKEFLTNLGISFDNQEIKNILSDPPDIQFREAYFEIKEIQLEGRKRHKEYKEKLEKAQKATSSTESMELYEPKAISLYNVIDRINSEMSKFKYSSDFSKNIDLLFYINLSRHHLSGGKNSVIQTMLDWKK